MTDPSPSPSRLRAHPVGKPFHVALIEPEIPPNTGNIARLCGATGSILHLVGKLGFNIDDHAVRRAGLDYWHLVRVETQPTLEAVEQRIKQVNPESRTWLFSGKTTKSYLHARFSPGDLLVFGKESVGLPDRLLEARAAEVVGIPTLAEVRSLNLANAVAIGLYEALRQCGALETPRGDHDDEAL